MQNIRLTLEGDEKKLIVSPNEYFELLEYKGKYEAMKEAYEKLLRTIEASQYSYPRERITYTPTTWFNHDTMTHPTYSSTRTSYGYPTTTKRDDEK